MKLSTKVLALVGCGLFALSPTGVQGDTTIFDGTNTFLSCGNCLISAGGTGDNGGTEVRLAWTIDAFAEDGYKGFFGNSDFEPTGGGVTNPVIIPLAEDVLEVTALQNPFNTSDATESDPGTPGLPATVRVFMTEVNPDLNYVDNDPAGPGAEDVWTITKEIYIYDFAAGDFGPADPNAAYTTLTKSVNSGWDQMTLLVDVYSDPGLYPGPLQTPTPDVIGNAFAGAFFQNDGSGFEPDFDTLGVHQMGFQTPTTDGANDGANEGLVDLEILLVNTTVPEPASVILTLFGMASLTLLRKK